MVEKRKNHIDSRSYGKCDKKSAYPDAFSYRWIDMVAQKLSPNFLEQGL